MAEGEPAGSSFFFGVRMADVLQMTFCASSLEEFADSWAKVVNAQSSQVGRQLSEILRYLQRSSTEKMLATFHERTVAEVLEGFPRADLQQARQRKARRKRIREIAQTGHWELVATLGCPSCGGPLNLRFDSCSVQPNGSTAGLVKVQCPRCASGSFIDGLMEPPPWVSEAGETVVTSPDASDT